MEAMGKSKEYNSKKSGEHLVKQTITKHHLSQIKPGRKKNTPSARCGLGFGDVLGYISDQLRYHQSKQFITSSRT